jgi:diguanylate cyclase (GGDEF)-like protein
LGTERLTVAGRAGGSLRAACDAIFVAGLLAALVLPGPTPLGPLRAHPAAVVLLAVGLFLGELLPIGIPRRGGIEEITLSPCFALALLLVGGLAPAAAVLCMASIAEDRRAGKPWWRVRFNIGQYLVALSASLLTLRAFGLGSRLGTLHPFEGSGLLAVLIAAGAFFAVNGLIVGVVVARHQGIPIRHYFRRDARFVLVSHLVPLMIAPLIVAACAYSVPLVALFLGPMLAVHSMMGQNARSEHAARHDSLTGLPNRVEFQHAVRTALRCAGRETCLLLVDLDRFKAVNDTHGHHCGDLLLRQIAERLRGELGSEDIVARLGGDEFAIAGPGRTRAEAAALAGRVAAALRRPFQLDGVCTDAPASIGLAMYPDDGDEVEALMRRADIAMYRAKAAGGDVAIYDGAPLTSPGPEEHAVELDRVLPA